jgi:tRNA threonylcarbamoyladenosine biosynthesis protein TsaE
MSRDRPHLATLSSRSPEETRAIGRTLGAALRPGDVIGLCGQLGAGKTCLVQGIAAGLEVSPSVGVASPTFGIVHEYPGRLTLYHMDFYRLGGSDLDEMGLEEVLEGEGVTVAEWPEHWTYFLEAAHLLVHIRGVGDSRVLQLEAAEPRFVEVFSPC